jgi:hypothetical protein
LGENGGKEVEQEEGKEDFFHIESSIFLTKREGLRHRANALK